LHLPPAWERSPALGLGTLCAFPAPLPRYLTLTVDSDEFVASPNAHGCAARHPANGQQGPGSAQAAIGFSNTAASA